MKIDLFLDGNKVQINDDIDFVLNKQYTELSDLTAIIVDYSKTIKVPMTAANNDLFNMIFKLDHQVIFRQDYYYFDPSKKISMQMVYNGNLVMEGYAVLNKINLNDHTYELNLYGQLGKIFSDLKKKTLKNYTLDESKWEPVVMNKDTVEKSFLYDRTDTSVTHETWCDYFGFAPQLYGKTDVLDTKKYQSGNDFLDFADIINTAKGITFGDTLVGDGFDFNQYGEIRSYMTRPYVWVDKIIEMVQDEINNGDYGGYTLVLDDEDIVEDGNVVSHAWFKDDNPYYSRMVYFPGNEPNIGKGQSVNGYLQFNRDLFYTPTALPYNFTPNVVDDELGDYSYDLTDGLFTIYKDDISSQLSVAVSIDMATITLVDTYYDCEGSIGDVSDFVWGFETYDQYGYSGIPVRYIGVYDENDDLLYKFLLPVDSTRIHRHQGLSHTVWGYSNLFNIYRSSGNEYVVPESVSSFVGYTTEPSSTRLQNVYRQQTFKFNSQVLDGNKFKFKMGCDVLSGYTGNILYENVGITYSYDVPFKNGKWKNVLSHSSHDASFKGIEAASVSSLSYRSGSIYKIDDILGADFNPFTWLMDYVKKFRLVFDIDYHAKTIFLTSNYFNNLEYITPVVDYSKEVTIEPIVNKYHEIRFGYADNQSDKGIQYQKKWDVDYGDASIVTPIELNDEVMWLNSNDKEGVMIPKDCSALNFDNLTTTGPIEYKNILGTSKVVNTLDTTGKIQYFPFFAMRSGNRVSAEYYISDDTPLQMSNGEFTLLDRSYAGGQYMVYENSIPQFDNYYIKIVRATGSDDGYVVLPSGRRVTTRGRGGSTTVRTGIAVWSSFQVPKEVYNGVIAQRVGSDCIYNRWKNYLNEIFNIHNKKITCWIRMSYPEYINFKFNKLFVIDGCTFLVNKIIDFDPNSSAPTKVELIQIQDPENLK